MGIDEVERGLALLSELSKNANSMKVRRSRHDEAPGLFSEFHRSLDGLIVSANNISGTVGANPNAVPHTIRTVFVDTMTAAEKTMSEVDNLLNVYCFESSGWFRAFVNTVKRFFLPKSSTAVMYDVKRHTVHLQSKLQHLWVRLVVHIFGEEMAAQIRQTIEESASPFDQLEAMPEIPPMMNKIQQATSLFETKLRAMTKGRQLHSAVSSSKPPPGRWRALGGGLQVSSLVLGHGPNGTVVYKG